MLTIFALITVLPSLDHATVLLVHFSVSGLFLNCLHAAHYLDITKESA
jgi:hypothetical protein